MIESIVELREFMKKEYPNATEEEIVFYMHGYFKGIEDTRLDVLERMKLNGKNNDDKPGTSDNNDKGFDAGTVS